MEVDSQKRSDYLLLIQLYEQLRQKKATSNEMAASLGLYVTRWQRWASAGMQDMTIDLYGCIQNPKELIISQATTVNG